MHLRLMTDYECYPLWEIVPNGVRNLPPQELPISDQLITRIECWQRTYDATLVREEPQRSGFATEEEEKAFELEGRSIWRELRAQLGPAYQVSYFSELEQRELE